MKEPKQNNLECLICFECVNKHGLFIQCDTCSSAYHHKCFNRWNEFKEDKIVNCPHCQQENIMIHRLPGIISNCFFPFFINKKTKFPFKTGSINTKKKT